MKTRALARLFAALMPSVPASAAPRQYAPVWIGRRRAASWPLGWTPGYHKKSVKKIGRRKRLQAAA